jgi:large subunit ribosomal protein L27
MSHVKASGSVAQHKQGNRHGKRLGVKKFGGEKVQVGSIIIRQRGATYKAGKHVGLGRDYTIFALKDGVVSYGKRHSSTVVNVLPE